MFNEDNSGYIYFPIDNQKINTIDTGKTLVYLVVFDPVKKTKDSKMENINLFSPGVFVSDDVMTRPPIKLNNTSLDSLIESDKEQQEYDALYFPYLDSNINEILFNGTNLFANEILPEKKIGEFLLKIGNDYI